MLPWSPKTRLFIKSSMCHRTTGKGQREREDTVLAHRATREGPSGEQKASKRRSLPLQLMTSVAGD